jgi:hypothetical protein
MTIYVAINTEDFDVIGIFNKEDDLVQALIKDRSIRDCYENMLEYILDSDDIENVRSINDFVRGIIKEGSHDGVLIETKTFE